MAYHGSAYHCSSDVDLDRPNQQFQAILCSGNLWKQSTSLRNAIEVTCSSYWLTQFMHSGSRIRMCFWNIDSIFAIFDERIQFTYVGISLEICICWRCLVQQSTTRSGNGRIHLCECLSVGRVLAWTFVIVTESFFPKTTLVFRPWLQKKMITIYCYPQGTPSKCYSPYSSSYSSFRFRWPCTGFGAPREIVASVRADTEFEPILASHARQLRNGPV